jgi:hypothetical protein
VFLPHLKKFSLEAMLTITMQFFTATEGDSQ